MNTGIIIRLEYRLIGENGFHEINFTGFSANFEEVQQETDSGNKFSLKINAKIPKIEKGKSSLLAYLLGRPMEVRFLDGNGLVHTAGNTSYPARLGYNQAIGGNPGDWNGYGIAIIREAPYPHDVYLPEVL